MSNSRMARQPALWDVDLRCKVKSKSKFCATSFIHCWLDQVSDFRSPKVKVDLLLFGDTSTDFKSEHFIEESCATA